MNPSPPAPFRFMDCALTILSLGRSAQNLRELRDGIAIVTVSSISHHFLEGLLTPAFDDPEYRNDFAMWARRHLHDNILAERLGGIDPMDYEDVEKLRQQALDVIEDRLAEIPFVPSVRPGREFYFLQAHRVILDTGLRARMGGKGQRFVRESILLTRQLREYLTMMLQLRHGSLEQVRIS